MPSLEPKSSKKLRVTIEMPSHTLRLSNDNPALIKLKVIILQNMSNCLLQTADLKEAVAMTSKAIELDSKAWKALFFRSQA